MRFVASFIFGLAAFFCGHAVVAETPDLGATLTLFRQGKAAYEEGNCKRVTQIFQTSEKTLVDDEIRLAEVHQMLAFCHFQQKNKLLAAKDLEALLLLNPDYELEPFATPPPLLEMFHSIRSDMNDKLDKIKLAKSQAIAQNAPIITKKDDRVKKVLSALVPFGYAQFLNGSMVKGALIAAGEAALIGLNIGSFWWKQSYVTGPAANGVSDASSASLYRTAQIVQLSSLAGALAVYLYATVDGLFLNDASETMPMATNDSIRLQLNRSLELAKLAAKEKRDANTDIDSGSPNENAMADF